MPVEVKMQDSSVDGSRPHQTGVTKCSIGDRDRHAADHIVEDVMVGHLADGIGAGVAAEADGHDHFFGVELALGLRQELRAGDGMEHPFEIVQASHDGGERDHEQGEREESLRQRLAVLHRAKARTKQARAAISVPNGAR